MRWRYDTDKAADYEVLMRGIHSHGGYGLMPRRPEHGYGRMPGMKPLGDYPDKLIDSADYKEVIARCHEQQRFPIYHQRASWGAPGVKWNQNGLGFCWAWGGTGCLMDCLAREGKPVPLLSPVSLGWLVNWNNQGNYLEDCIRGLTTRGVCEMRFTPDPHSLKHRQYVDGWEENALLYRLGDGEVFDADNRTRKSMIQHAISILATGTPGYIAYNWWGHALELVAVVWDESETNNLVWQIRNSHNEDDVIELTGSRAVPDELYGIAASLTLVS